MRVELTREEGHMRVEVGRSRHIRPVAAAVLTVSLLGGALVLLFSGEAVSPPAALQPYEPQPAAPQPAETQPAERRPAETLPAELLPAGNTPAQPALGGLGAGLPASGGLLPGSVSPPVLPAAPSLPVPQLPQFPAAPSIDWQAALQPYIQSQINAAAANLAGSITGTAAGAGLNSAALAVGDLILYAAYSNDGQGMLSQLQSAAPALQSALPAPPDLSRLPDFSGLAPAFAAAAAQPPWGVLTPPAGLPNLPTPEQVAAALAVPAVGLPALPPINLPPPPPIGLPTIGFPSITRLFGLPF